MEIDPRGPRTAALITTAVLAAVLITGSGWLLAVQALVFAAGAAGYAAGLTLLIRRIRPGRQALADPGLAENVAGR